MNPQKSHPVLIVGAGPIGQMMALLLSHHGIPTCLIDKRSEISTAPKAHAVNPRTLEICDSIGINATKLRALGASANDGGDVRFVGTLTGPEFGHLPYERQDDDAYADTPFPLSNIPQPVFEAALMAYIERDDNIEFHRGIQFVESTDGIDGVDVTLVEAATGIVSQQRYDYVIAADGANSSIRDALEIAMDGPGRLQDFLMIHFSADLQSLTKDRRGVLYFLFEPGVQGTLIAYDHSKTWVLMHPWNKDDENIDSYDNELCLQLIEKAVGASVANAKIENIGQWSMSAQVAERYRKGRTFLVGDSAHRFPPAGGLGLNTGVGDAQNLAWKLAAVLHGKANKKLLNTYETERQPIANTNSEQSLTNTTKLFELIAAIVGFDPDPEKVQRQYQRVASDPGSCNVLAQAIEAQKPHFDSFGLQLGYRYDSTATINAAHFPMIDDISDYQPSWDSGAHFPHCWVISEGQRSPLQAYIPANSFSLLSGPEAKAFTNTDYCQQIRINVDVCLEQQWARLTGLPNNGAVLIRPDGHIAARLNDVNSEAVHSMLRSLLSNP